ncbi:MAG: hypothetical protein A3B10_03650 [Candidatus Doudnabacteria bacterium RIFCSPLOWO2_01_FULL_44_21]|uniref:Uncharacterized protein n=1 Tax=Candidatus Doudnabacteria bacterium RIFCSPLOWO2_01_FULL_44_21 TaxID=1817841 RepID=A0A1F5PY42_9BACT|nr:MAG: hypothetical protein A3B95_02195 [Candidatus Doudnabacteria bacterium RIFCSPHIGHO2_02_FULL_43_13b]OGE94858.1 MAG: hypothetical protein A3B10_03650 [Candidatus Doudnabacteria bacterium RIFCSPLOWO2_01_FULL_44_21]
MFYILLSIVVLTLVLWVINQWIKNVLCPVCSATVITWVAVLVLYYLSQPVNTLFLTILISVSLGAIIEKYGHKFSWHWKLIMVLLNAPAIYFLMQKDLTKAVTLALVSVVLTWFMSRLKVNKREAKDDRFKQCC